MPIYLWLIARTHALNLSLLFLSLTSLCLPCVRSDLQIHVSTRSFLYLLPSFELVLLKEYAQWNLDQINAERNS